MQTAIHFEGDLAYICVSDQGEIKEEEPVTYGRSRVEFVISTAQAQKEGTIGSCGIPWRQSVAWKFSDF